MDAAWTNLTDQAPGHGASPGAVRCPLDNGRLGRFFYHLLLPSGRANLEATMKSFRRSRPPLTEIDPGKTYVTDERRPVSLKRSSYGTPGWTASAGKSSHI